MNRVLNFKRRSCNDQALEMKHTCQKVHALHESLHSCAKCNVIAIGFAHRPDAIRDHQACDTPYSCVCVLAAVQQIPPQISMAAAREEAEMVLFDSVRHVLEDARLKPGQVSQLLCSCHLWVHCPPGWTAYIACCFTAQSTCLSQLRFCTSVIVKC